ncbi:hypothetical protein CHISP_1411 [Chitinispirillum alkaliphilum]|nr:hypothetical protein CHISP_1411 [Chitinispirillum alkaliphilum]
MHRRKKTEKILRRLIRKKVAHRNSSVHTTGTLSSSAYPETPSGVQIDTNIPEYYNDTYIRAIPRDPEHVFVYWEIGTETKKLTQKYMGEEVTRAKETLRLTQINSLDDIPKKKVVTETKIERKPDNRVIEVPKPGKTYQVQFGLKSAQGNFLPITNSKPLPLPSRTVSEPRPDRKEKVDTEAVTRLSLEGMPPEMGLSEQISGLNLPSSDSQTEKFSGKTESGK